MKKIYRIAAASGAVLSAGLVFQVARAGADPVAAPPPSNGSVAPKGSFFDSFKQAFTQDLNREVVRGHLDVGTPPDSHRFYCLVDPKTGKREEYAVGGEPFVRPDGMTGLRAGAVTPNSCSAADAEGRLVSDGYTVKLGNKAASRPPAAPVAAAAPAAAAAAPRGTKASPAEHIDVAGIRLGMTPDQVRAALHARALGNYFEGSGSLGLDTGYLNEIAAWGGVAAGSESYEVLFTPVPGKERVAAVIHSVTYPAQAGPAVAAWQAAVLHKYGGFAAPADLPAAATWRVREDGQLEGGDTCERRGVVGGLASGQPSLKRDNLSLRTTAEEFRYQIQHCGAALVTSDLATTSGQVQQYTVTAYSPAIGLEGATAAAQIIQGSGQGGMRGSGADTGGTAVNPIL